MFYKSGQDQSSPLVTQKNLISWIKKKPGTFLEVLDISEQKHKDLKSRSSYIKINDEKKPNKSLYNHNFFVKSNHESSFQDNEKYSVMKRNSKTSRSMTRLSRIQNYKNVFFQNYDK